MARTREEIIYLLKQLASGLGVASISWRQFAREAGVREEEWRLYFEKWNDLVREAELVPQSATKRKPDGEIFDALIAYMVSCKRWPTWRGARIYQKNNPGFPEWQTITLRGSGVELARKVLNHCGNRKDLDGVREICLAKIAKSTTGPGENGPGAPASQVKGWVYLHKHEKGRYRIGRTDSPNRREQEHARNVPYKIDTVHAIPTVAPSALERYWHLRFKDKRIEGEYFKLDREDIEAFKRRKDDL